MSFYFILNLYSFKGQNGDVRLYIHHEICIFAELSTMAEVVNSKMNLITTGHQLYLSSFQNGVLLVTFNFKMLIAQKNISTIIVDIF